MKNRVLRLLLLSASVLSLSLLVAPATEIGLALSLFFAIIVISLIWLLSKRLGIQPTFHKGLLIFDATAIVMLCQDFYVRWFPARKMQAVASFFQLQKHLFLMITASVLGVLSFCALDTMLALLLSTAHDIAKGRKGYYRVRKGFLILLVTLFQLYSLGFSSVFAVYRIVYISVFSFLANFGIILLFNTLLYFLTRKWDRALILSSALFFLWSLANYYTIQFHGSPLYLSEFLNAGAAAAVAKNYKYQISAVVIGLVLLLAAELKTIIRNRKQLEVPLFQKGKQIRPIALFMVVVLLTGICSSVSMQRFQSWRPWDLSIEENGFVICVIQDLKQRANPIRTPEDYDETALLDIDTTACSEQLYGHDDTEYPDIIIILNETFFDMAVYSDMNMDSNPLSEFYSIDNAVYGFAVSPNIGGGTNNSEFELLTSKSMFLLNSFAPFTYLGAEQLERSSVQLLKQVGYHSVGMHCGVNRTYSRNSAYPLVGFESVQLGSEVFEFRKNGNRPWLDSDNYLDLIEQYEAMEDGPRLVYLLTFQNHGGYEQNDASLDTVHVLNDFGPLTDDINEYLSSLELSAKAFHELTDFYSQSEREVIICMVGDHAPSFISELSPEHEMTFEESEIAKRSVPYIIWANYDLEFPNNTEYVSMVDLLPMVMDAAGLPLTPYYQFILRLHDAIPVRTSTGLYRDVEGNYGYFEKDDPNYDLLRQYYYMEYNSLITGEDYRRDLFELR